MWTTASAALQSFQKPNSCVSAQLKKKVVRIWLFAKWRVWRDSNPKLHTLWAMAMQLVRSKVAAWKSCSVKINDTCHQVRRNQTPSCGVQLSGRGCSMVANKTLYTLASANQNSIYIAGLRRETLYTLRPFERKLYIHWANAGPQWTFSKCLKKSHRKKKWHWFTPNVTK